MKAEGYCRFPPFEKSLSSQRWGRGREDFANQEKIKAKEKSRDDLKVSSNCRDPVHRSFPPALNRG